MVRASAPAHDPVILSQSRVTISFLVLSAGTSSASAGAGEPRTAGCIPGASSYCQASAWPHPTILLPGDERTNRGHPRSSCRHRLPCWCCFTWSRWAGRRRRCSAWPQWHWPWPAVLLRSGWRERADSGSNPAGVIAAMLAAVSFSFYNIAGHNILARYDRWIVLLYTTFSAGAFWLVVNPPWKLVAAHYSGPAWGFLLVFAVVSVLAAIFVILRGATASRADAGDRGELPGAGVLYRHRGDRIGRGDASRAGVGDRSSPVRNCAGAVAGSGAAGEGTVVEPIE